MKPYRVLEHGADVGIIAYGEDLKQVFTNAARGFLSLVVEPRSVKESLSDGVSAEAEDEPALMVAWLNELIYLLEVERFLFRRFEVLSLTPTHLAAKGYGERLDPLRHHLRRIVKAATYHMLEVKKVGGGFRARVVFDI